MKSNRVAPALSQGQVILGSVLYITLVGDVLDDDRALQSFLPLLWGIVGRTTGYHIFTLTGAIIVIPDSYGLKPFLAQCEALRNKLEVARVPVRFGISRGSVQALTDVDARPNLIGRAVVEAARLAFSHLNKNYLMTSEFVEFMGDSSSSGAFSRKEIAPDTIPGKSHDGSGFNVYRPTALAEWASAYDAECVPQVRKVEHHIGLIMAFDLSNYSAGDNLQISKRFRSLVDVFDRLRSRWNLLEDRMNYFSPGGDGGVFMAVGNGEFAGMLDRDFDEMLSAENWDRSDAINVSCRVGVHYGPFYTQIVNRTTKRPFGHHLTIADKLAADKHARECSAIIYSGSVVDTVAMGSAAVIAERFRELPDLSVGRTTRIKRYVRRIAENEKGLTAATSLIAELSGPDSRWKQE